MVPHDASSASTSKAQMHAGDHHSLIEMARLEPWRAGYMPLMRWLGATRHDLPPPGHASRPQDEAFRLGQTPALTFAPREIAEVSTAEGRVEISLFGLGMLGPNGPLPIHFTEIARERKESGQDGTLVAFLNIFHHRHLTQLYRAGASAQSAAGLDRSDSECFSRYVAQLTGTKPGRSDLLPSHARLAGSAHLVREARNPDGLSATLAQFFGVPIRIREFVLHWIRIEPEEHSRLGVPGLPGVLGTGALLGEMVPDRQHRFRLSVGPLDLDQYLRLTPQGRDLPVLTEWVRAFIGHEFAWEIELRLRRSAVPAAHIGSPNRLGWSTWLGEAGDDEAVTGMVFEPELYGAPHDEHS